MTYDLAYLILAVFGAYTTYRLVGVFCGKPSCPAWMLWVGYSLYLIVISYVHLILRIPLLVMAANILTIYGLTCLYDAGWRKKITGTLFTYLFLFMTETAVVLLLGYLDLDYTGKSTFSSQWGLLFIRIATYAAVIIMEQYRYIRQGDLISFKNGILVMGMPVLTICLALLFLAPDSNNTQGIAAVILILLLLNFSVVFLYDALTAQAIRLREQAVLAVEKAACEKQLELMQETQKTLAAARHDLKNHLIAIQGFAVSGDTADIIDYVHRISGQLQLSDLTLNTGNLSIDSICSFKALQAHEKGITLQTSIQIPKSLPLESYEITIILGNLLDNAIEALESMQEIKKEIHLKIKYEKGGLLLSVTNKYSGGLLWGKENKKQIPSSKKTAEHGLGLENIKKAVERCDGIMEITAENGIFQVLIVLPLPFVVRP